MDYQRNAHSAHAQRAAAALLIAASCLAGLPAPAGADDGLAGERQTYDSASESWDASLEGGAGNEGAVDVSYTVVADEAPAPAEEEPPASAPGSTLPQTGDSAIPLALAAVSAVCASAAALVARADALRRKEGAR